MPNRLKITHGLTGPVFEGKATEEVKRFLIDAEQTLANAGMRFVLDVTAARFKTRTPVYETRVQVRALNTNRLEVWDQGIVYGPWLEGTGSRNAISRFKGYRMFRIAKNRLDTERSTLLREPIQRLMRGLNG
jgi:hypothetical protein